MKLTPVLGSPVQGGGKGRVIVSLRGGGHQGDGGNGDPLVDDGDAELRSMASPVATSFSAYRVILS